MVKEKFKMLKNDLKIWNKQVFGSIERNIDNFREEIRKLDMIDEVFGLEEYEVIKRNESNALLLRELKRKHTLSYQKARCKWINEGDCNTRFFHNYINRRRKINELIGIKVDGEWKEEVVDVKNDIFYHFQ